MDAAIRADIEAVEERLLRDGSPFALSDVDIAGNRCRIFRNGPQSLSDIYRKTAVLKQSILVVQGTDRISYGEIFRKAGRLAQGLAGQFGVGPGTRVVIALETGPAWITTFIAITALGASAVLSGRRDPAAPHLCCELAQCSLIVTDGGAGAFIGLQDGASPVLLDALIAQAGRDEWTPATPSGDDEAIIAFTSGSTGMPKAAVLTHRGIVTGLLNMMLAGALANAQAHLAQPKAPRRPQLPSALLLSPLAHISGYGQLLLTMMMGGKLICPASDHADEIVRWIGREKVTSIAGATPATIRALLDALPSRHDISSLASLNINGFALHPRLVKDIESKLPDITIATGYGMTETNGSVCAIAGEALKSRPRSCGRVVPTVECKITDDFGKTLAAEQAGNIWLRGAMTMRGYSGTDAQPLADGWLNTGDIGYLSSDRHLHILDRRDDFIATASGKISGLEIERVVVESVDVCEAAVICGSGKFVPTIFVLSTGTLDVSSLRSRLMLRFGQFACGIVQLAEFPRTLSGKIDRRHLEAHSGNG